MSESSRIVAVVGGGPAGLMAAERLARAGIGVNLYEGKPTAGRKLLIAGRGGLNLTHSEMLETFVTRYGPDAARFADLLTDFSPTDLHALACKSKRNAVAIASVGGISSTILAAMDRHSSNASVVDAAIDVLHMLATKGDAKNLLQNKIADAGSIQKIIDAMDCHTDNAELQESACNTLRALLNRDEVCKKHVTLAGGGLRGMLKERVERAMGMEGARAKTVDHGDKILRFLGILGDP